MDRLEPAPTPADDEQERVIQSLFRDIERSGGLPPHVAAFEAADTVLCALEMRLPRAQAEEVVRDVPPMLRMLLRRCVMHETERPEVSFDELAFLRLVASALRISVEQAERVTRAVFVAVQKLMAEDEILDVRGKLPRELNALWLPPSMSGLEPFEPPPPVSPAVTTGARPLEEPTERILREIEQSRVLPERLSAIEALQAVLCTLSLELTAHEAQELADTTRTFEELLVPCVIHRGERPEVMYRQTFLRRLADHLGVDEGRAERVAHTVFAAVRGRLGPDEIHKIDNRLPRSVRPLWIP